MDNFVQVTPFLHVPDVEAAVRFFTDVLGFRVLLRREDYAYVHRETVGFRLLKHSLEDEGPLPERGGFAYYIDVRDVDALHEELRPSLATLLPGDVYGPVNQSYGQRELMVRAPDRRLIVFGQELPRAAPTDAAPC